MLPDFRDYAVDVPSPGTTVSEAMRVLGAWVRDVVRLNPDNFRVFGPDETASNRLGDVFSVTGRAWVAETAPTDEDLSPDGRVVEVLSEHLCQGWLEGYLLTGRHGVFNCYEAFIHIVDSMFNQHAKWLKVTRGDSVAPADRVAQLPPQLARLAPGPQRLLAPGSRLHRPRREQEGRDHPGLPARRTPTRLSVTDHCLRSRDYVNVVVAGKQPALNYLPMDEAIVHCTRGLGIWDWASNDEGGEPDVVLGCCGDVPTLETLAAASILRERLPELKVRVVNVVDLMRLQPEKEHPHGLPDTEFDSLFTRRSRSCSRTTGTPG